MKKKLQNKIIPDKYTEEKKELIAEAYPLYPIDADIHSKNINQEDLTKLKKLNINNQWVSENENHSTNDLSGSDLNAPGSELDDEQEAIRREDEENNYYKIGSDVYDYQDEDRV